MRLSILTLWATALTPILASPPGQPTWQDLAPLSSGPRQEHSGASINTTLYIVGGLVPIGNPPRGVETIATAEAYDIPTNTWRPIAPLPVAMNHLNLVSANNRLLVLGGLSGNINGSFRALPDAFEYDPLTDSWEALPPLPEGTARGSAVVGVYRDEVILAGGVERIEQRFGGEQITVDTVSAFNFRTRTWRSLPSLPEGREHAGGAVIGDTFFVVGGRVRGEANVRDTVLTLSLETWKWTNTRAPMPTARGGISVAAVGGRIFAFGGEGNPDPTAGNTFNETEVYDVRRDSVTVGKTVYTPAGGIRDFAVTDRLQAFHPGGL
ncbi:hypothetical protein B0T11DRAFT_357064 [Plectosphaerella cucumerina]|uniref:Galactose oxidase n=1 Tax=Plectosphaerella cucumerina TaxID=40658 RepID=A0A8K0T9H3_9PEZI|nr:hypothetical protein B0T11DRAFT_357064 [Plectosphaerella cucumerina]